MAIAVPHVLVVDACSIHRFIATKVFKSCNTDIKVTTVEGPQQALEFLDAEHDVNLILTGYCMRERMTGFDLLMRVKESARLKHIPVVIVSSEDIPERVKNCLDAGAKEFIIKPLRIADVPRILNYI